MRHIQEVVTNQLFLYVPEGRFLMGGHEKDEQPVHWVQLSEFWLARTPVTNRQYAVFLKQTGHGEPDYWREHRFSESEQPVVGVSWHDAQHYCRWLTEVSGLPVLLPTEAQWEYAARGPEGREYPWGDQKPDSTLARFGLDWVKGKPAPVGSYPDGAGPFGHLDLAGNVWEWCRDEVDPLRVLRGGSWSSPAESLRAACRFWPRAAGRIHLVGFRLAAKGKK